MNISEGNFENVYFDTCTYRNICTGLCKEGIDKAEQILKERVSLLKGLEASASITPYANSYVLWELISHLPTKEALQNFEMKDVSGQDLTERRQASFKEILYAIRFCSQHTEIKHKPENLINLTQILIADNIGENRNNIVNYESYNNYKRVMQHIYKVAYELENVMFDKWQQMPIDLAESILWLSRELWETKICSERRMNGILSTITDVGEIASIIKNDMYCIFFSCVNWNRIDMMQIKPHVHKFLDVWISACQNSICDSGYIKSKKNGANNIIDSLLVAPLNGEIDNKSYIFVTNDKRIISSTNEPSPRNCHSMNIKSYFKHMQDTVQSKIADMPFLTK